MRTQCDHFEKDSINFECTRHSFPKSQAPKPAIAPPDATWFDIPQNRAMPLFSGYGQAVAAKTAINPRIFYAC
jgi:hypothetical protein